MWPFSSSQPKLYTGKLLPASEVTAALKTFASPMLGKAFYAEVNSKSIVWLAQQARDKLWAMGINKWREDATCTVFANEFVQLGNKLFFQQAFHDPISTQLCALAVGDYWFHPDNTMPDSRHAIGVALTERGPLWVDPQAPDTIRAMSSEELLSYTTSRFL